MKIIAVAGQMRNGKNKIGEYICRKMNFIPASFATPVKNIFCDAFNVDMEFVEKWKVEKDPPPGFEKNVRQSLQFIGDGFRQIFPDVWIDYAIRNNPDYSCFMDGRYLNEMFKVKQKGGINILVWRPSFENNDPNPSESEIKPLVDYYSSKKVEGCVKKLHSDKSAPDGSDLIDFFIINNGTLEDLYAKIDKYILTFLPLVESTELVL